MRVRSACAGARLTPDPQTDGPLGAAREHLVDLVSLLRRRHRLGSELLSILGRRTPRPAIALRAIAGAGAPPAGGAAVPSGSPISRSFSAVVP